jgi:hypothetical protein
MHKILGCGGTEYISLAQAKSRRSSRLRLPKIIHVAIRWDRNYTKDAVEVIESTGKVVLQVRALPTAFNYRANGGVQMAGVFGS